MGKMVPKIEISDSVTVYTKVLDVGDISYSTSMSTAAVNANANAKSSKKRNQKKEKKKKKNSTRSTKRVLSTTSLDRKMLDTEAKIQKQVRELASDSFIAESERNLGNKDEGKQKMRLMTTSGVLLFDGLGELTDSPMNDELQLR